MKLDEFFKEHNKVALAFSGGVDSSYLLYAGIKNKADIKAYYVKSEFQPQFEFDDALRLAADLNANIEVINLSVLKNEQVIKNPPNRCYYCKQTIFNEILKHAANDGYTTVLDGTNASDDASDRPGMKALKELKVLSPLRECGLTKDMIRKLSKEAGLFTHDKPAYACLATRIPTGKVITKELLECVEGTENILFDLGFTDFRARVIENGVKLQLKADQMEKALRQREEIILLVKPYFETIVLDLEGR